MDETRHGEQSNNDGMHTETEIAGGSRFSINSKETSSVMIIKAVDDEGYKKVTKSSRKVMVIAILFGVPFAWLLSFWNFIISVLLCVALIVALLLAEKAATAVYKGEENAAGLYLGCFFLGAPIALVGVGVAFYFQYSFYEAILHEPMLSDALGVCEAAVLSAIAIFLVIVPTLRSVVFLLSSKADIK